MRVGRTACAGRFYAAWRVQPDAAGRGDVMRRLETAERPARRGAPVSNPLRPHGRVLGRDQPSPLRYTETATSWLRPVTPRSRVRRRCSGVIGQDVIAVEGFDRSRPDGRGRRERRHGLDVGLRLRLPYCEPAGKTTTPPDSAGAKYENHLLVPRVRGVRAQRLQAATVHTRRRRVEHRL